jgi:hypothetical protein
MLTGLLVGYLLFFVTFFALVGLLKIVSPRPERGNNPEPQQDSTDPSKKLFSKNPRG